MQSDESSRRRWLLQLGSGAVLAGFSGMDLESAPQPPLPAGLYQPSIDHLAHVLKPPAGTGEPPAPLFFAAPEYKQITNLVATMLGEDPAAAPVPEIAAWIDLLVHDAPQIREAAQSLSAAHRAVATAFHGEETMQDAQQICRAGLARLKADPSYTLESLESAGDPFIQWLKHRVIEGFYTSQKGLQELDYRGNAFYSTPPGCDGRRI